MYPQPANPPSFEYPGDRLLRFCGFIPDEEMHKPGPKTKDHENDPVIMVIKKYYFKKDEDGQMSKEIAVLPRNSKSGTFSQPGDSGSSVIDSRGRFAGLLTGGAGVSKISDVTYLTSVNFLRARMTSYGLRPNFFPISIH